MDRVDLQVSLAPVRSGVLLDGTVGEPSELVAKRVAEARAMAGARWAGLGRTNASVPSAVLRRPPFKLSRAVLAPLTSEVDRGLLSARGFNRVVRVAWTIADLDGRSRPDQGDICEAVELRARRQP
jgi:magnesium chelatase family protein